MAEKSAKKILLIDENALKSAISTRWSLLLTFLADDIEGQDLCDS